VTQTLAAYYRANLPVDEVLLDLRSRDLPTLVDMHPW
jgi:hypothetical protein